MVSAFAYSSIASNPESPVPPGSCNVPNTAFCYSTKASDIGPRACFTGPSSLPHLNRDTHEVYQISVAAKKPTHRTAVAIGHVHFTSAKTLEAIRSHLLKKGDVLAVARIGGIQAVKDTSRTVVLAHNVVGVEGCEVEVASVSGHRSSASDDTSTSSPTPPVETQTPRDLDRVKNLAAPIAEHGGIRIAVTVETTAKTGVEMEALAGVMGAALNVIDMVKAIDKGASIENVRVVGKRGGKSGDWGILHARDRHVNTS